MSGVLDELRKKFTQEITRLEENERWTHADTTMLSVGLSFIDAFEAAHPGLVDYTVECPLCHRKYASVTIDWTPWPGVPKGEWENHPVVCPLHRGNP